MKKRFKDLWVFRLGGALLKTLAYFAMVSPWEG